MTQVILPKKNLIKARFGDAVPASAKLIKIEGEYAFYEMHWCSFDNHRKQENDALLKDLADRIEKEQG